MGQTRDFKVSNMDWYIKDKEKCCYCCYCTRWQKITCCTLLWLPILVIVGLFIALMVNGFLLLDDPFQLKVFDTAEDIFINATTEEVMKRSVRLGKAIQFKTVSYARRKYEKAEILKLHRFIEHEFPGVHNSNFITREVVNKYSLIYRVEGSEKTENPYMLCAHLDVVPEGDISGWNHDPFLGEIVEEDNDTFIFGRGAIDDKHSVFGIMEALEFIVQSGRRPNRTFYIALGHDEEVNGLDGAAKIAVKMEEELRTRGETLDFILDEGMVVLEGVIPGVSERVIYIGVAEKGYLTLELTAKGVQGHSSLPPDETAITILSEAIVNLKETKQPSRFGEGPEIDTFRYIAPHASFLFKAVLGNMWLFKGILPLVLSSNNNMDATQRTTSVVTIVEAGFKENVIPAEAKATLNHRLHPVDDKNTVIQEDERIIDDSRVKKTVISYKKPPKISPYSNNVIPFQVVAKSALEVFPGAFVIPGVMTANTDTLHYVNLTDKIYRFSPSLFKESRKDLDRVHGLNERISVDNYAKVVEFYHRMILNADTDIKHPYDIEEEEEEEEEEGSGSGSGPSDSSGSGSEEPFIETSGSEEVPQILKEDEDYY